MSKVKNNSKLLIGIAVTLCVVACANIDNKITDNKNANVVIEQEKKTSEHYKPDIAMNRFIKNLMNKMTLAEKIGQTVLYSSTWDITGPIAEDHDFTQAAVKGNVGAVFNGLTVDFLHRLQKKVVEQSRLGIPLLFGYDVIHGYQTTFPIPLAQAASWDINQIEKSARIATNEASADGLHWTFAPMVDIARDPRWGRVAEGAGEDHFLGSKIAAAQVRGIQGTDLSANNTMLATAKHYAAYGAAKAGRDYHTVDMSDRTLRDIYLPPFKAALDAGVATFMTAFNEFDGVPASANKYLLDDILRKQWGFNGFVVTDYTSIKEMINHGNVKDEKDAGEQSINAGVDMDMQSGIFMKYLSESVADGSVNISRVNDAVRRILEMKYRLGLFDDPYRYSNKERAKSVLKNSAHFDAAREMARKSIVLLKNKNNLLPLNKNIRSIALIGPMAEEKQSQLGTWHTAGRAETVTSIAEALKRVVSKDTKITIAKGSDWEGDDRSLFTKAINAAKNADIVLLAIGEKENMTGEAASRVNIDLPQIQKELIKQIHSLNKPTVLLLHNGRPLTITWENENIDAILEVWHLGSQAGPAIMDVVFGDYNPSGKLPITFPRHLGQVPIHYNMKRTGRPYTQGDYFTSRYQDLPNDPLYPFGYGLSYTTFKYSDITLNKTTISPEESIHVAVKVSNTGKFRGVETAQLYVRDLVGSVTRPVKELKGFKQVHLNAGESQIVRFELSAKELGFYRRDMSFGVEAGEFQLFVGTDSNATLSANFLLSDSAQIRQLTDSAINLD